MQNNSVLQCTVYNEQCISTAQVKNELVYKCSELSAKFTMYFYGTICNGQFCSADLNAQWAVALTDPRDEPASYRCIVEMCH